MKPIGVALVMISLFSGGLLQAQDAATQERLDKLAGQIEDIIASQRAQQKQMETLSREIDALREQAGKHTGNYATQEELKALREAVKEIDRKRLEDSDRISKKLESLGNELIKKSTAIKPAPSRSNNTEQAEKSTPEKGYSHTVQSGDTLSTIVQAYREKNIKVSTDQILKANPGLKPEKLKVGQQIWIPAPKT